MLSYEHPSYVNADAVKVARAAEAYCRVVARDRATKRQNIVQARFERAKKSWWRKLLIKFNLAGPPTLEEAEKSLDSWDLLDIEISGEGPRKQVERLGKAARLSADGTIQVSSAQMDLISSFWPKE